MRARVGWNRATKSGCRPGVDGGRNVEKGGSTQFKERSPVEGSSCTVDDISHLGTISLGGGICKEVRRSNRRRCRRWDCLAVAGA